MSGLSVLRSVVGPESGRDTLGVLVLAERVLLEVDRERLHVRSGLGHITHHDARVHSPGEERTERHVGHQPLAGRVGEQLVELWTGVLEAELRAARIPSDQ